MCYQLAALVVGDLYTDKIFIKLSELDCKIPFTSCLDKTFPNEFPPLALHIFINNLCFCLLGYNRSFPFALWKIEYEDRSREAAKRWCTYVRIVNLKNTSLSNLLFFFNWISSSEKCEAIDKNAYCTSFCCYCCLKIIFNAIVYYSLYF